MKDDKFNTILDIRVVDVRLTEPYRRLKQILEEQENKKLNK